jgi:hypothetical protein
MHEIERIDAEVLDRSAGVELDDRDPWLRSRRLMGELEHSAVHLDADALDREPSPVGPRDRRKRKVRDAGAEIEHSQRPIRGPRGHEPREFMLDRRDAPEPPIDDADEPEALHELLACDEGIVETLRDDDAAGEHDG